MGCTQSRKLKAVGSAPTVEPKEGEFQDLESHQFSLSTPWNSTEDSARQPSSPPARVSPSRAASAASVAPPEVAIVWKLDEEEIENMETNARLEELRSLARVDMGGTPNICLFGNNLVWFKTNTGAFSPGLAPDGTPFKYVYDAFQNNKDASAIVVPDLTKVPELASHPTVTERPHVSYYHGSISVSQGYHPLGVLVNWTPTPGRQPSQQKCDTLRDLAAKMTVILQSGLERVLKVFDTVLPEDWQLPAVWVDISDPEWRVVGINKEWEELTGVDLRTLTDFPGLLTVMIPSDGSLSSALNDWVEKELEVLRPDASISIILSPRAHIGGSLQFAMGVQRSTSAPPSAAAAELSCSVKAEDLCVVRVHARMQPDIHRRDFARTDLATAVSLPAQATTSTKDSLGLTPRISEAEAKHSSGTSHSSTPNTSFYTSSDERLAKQKPVTEKVPRIPPRLSYLTVGKLLGTGSYANVYAGMWGNRPVAVKLLQNVHGPDQAKEEWAAHCEALVSCDALHDNVVQTLDFCRTVDALGWQVWIVQELCELSLFQAIKVGLFCQDRLPGGPPNMLVILQTARDIARGMRYLHSIHTVHADLSANNVMLVRADNARGFVAKVADFGLTRVTSAADATKTVGTVSYMPPEVLLDGIVSSAGDVYAFAVLLFELFTSKRAWEGRSQAQIIFAVTCQQERLKMPEDAPEDYAKLAMDCMASDPEDRPTFADIVPRIDAMLTKYS